MQEKLEKYYSKLGSQDNPATLFLIYNTWYSMHIQGKKRLALYLHIIYLSLDISSLFLSPVNLKEIIQHNKCYLTILDQE